ncbi:hypothetical protein CDD83_11057 [Cordyceps sp. RAO-2017]|nr:hypothetical protein CDD83_11057 [Cordyceps sp. RAO-2017]
MAKSPNLEPSPVYLIHAGSNFGGKQLRVTYTNEHADITLSIPEMEVPYNHFALYKQAQDDFVAPWRLPRYHLHAAPAALPTPVRGGGRAKGAAAVHALRVGLPHPAIRPAGQAGRPDRAASPAGGGRPQPIDWKNGMPQAWTGRVRLLRAAPGLWPPDRRLNCARTGAVFAQANLWTLMGP